MHTGSSGSLIIVPVLGSNPNPDSPCLEIEFESYSRPVIFPDDEQIEDYCQWIEKRNRDSSHFRHSTTYMSSPTTVSFRYHESPLPSYYPVADHRVRERHSHRSCLHRVCVYACRRC